MFPTVRLRRLRNNEAIRKLIEETSLSVNDFVMPYFIIEGKNKKNPVSSMPGICQFSIDNILRELENMVDLKIQAILLFGIPKKKDDLGSEAYSKTGIIQKAVKEIKKNFKEILVITDICLCEYTGHGHCGIIKRQKSRVKGQESRCKSQGSKVKSQKSKVIVNNHKLSVNDYQLDNDETLKLVGRIAVSQAEAGADIVAPSAMMDGQVKIIRDTLDENGFNNIPIMAYSAKFASAFYSPFREAAESAPKFGDRRSYQMNPANSNEAMREIELDIKEGADIIMVKPALSYLDIISRAKERFNLPIAAYNVSGEYSMIKAASEKGWIDERRIVIEIITSIKRAGADIIITYFAKDVAKYIT